MCSIKESFSGSYEVLIVFSTLLGSISRIFFPKFLGTILVNFQLNLNFC